MAAEALLTTRDGIVGAPLHFDPHVRAGSANDPANLVRLSPDVRASIFMFEMGSRVTFSETKCDTATANLWRQDAVSGQPPKIHETPLVSITAPAVSQFKQQMAYLGAYADLRADRAAEILEQTTAVSPFLASIAFLDPARTPFTLELMSAALRFTNYCGMRMKYGIAAKRPIEYSPQVQPIIMTPTHGSLPSGHATEAFITARLLWKLMRGADAKQYSQDGVWGEMFMRLAARIATNRTIAGVHFPVDSVAGAVLGLTLADYVAALCDPHADNLTSASFHGPAFPATDDFDWHKLYVVKDDHQHQSVGPKSAPWVTSESQETTPDMISLPLAWLWKKAQNEWNDFAL